MVVRNGDLHLLVPCIRITMAQEYHLIYNHTIINICFPTTTKLKKNLVLKLISRKYAYFIVVGEVVVGNGNGS